MNKANFNENYFVRGVVLPLAIEDSYRLIATSGGIEKWFVDKASFFDKYSTVRRKEEYALQKDKYELDWGYKEFKVSGEVLDAEPNKMFKFTFGKLYEVTVTVEDLNGRTLFKLRQDHISDERDHDNYINCYGCWTFYLNNIRSVVETGLDLREREFEIDELVNR